MSKFVRSFAFIAIVLSFLLTACGTSAAPVVETQVVNQVVTATPILPCLHHFLRDPFRSRLPELLSRCLFISNGPMLFNMLTRPL